MNSIDVKANLLAATAVFSLFSIAAIIYLSFFDLRQPPIEITYTHPVTIANEATDRSEIVNKTYVTHGEIFYTYREYCIRYGYRVLRNERWLVSVDNPQVRYALPLLPSRTWPHIGACEKKSFLNEIPKGIPAGEYWFMADWAYMLDGNPIATHYWTWPQIKVVVK